MKISDRSKWWFAAASGLSLLLFFVGCGEAGPRAEAHPAPITAPAAPAAAPRAVIDITEHNFGFIDHEEQVSHKFVVKNEGNAPLVLERGPTTCKCTMSELASRPIPPGQSADVAVSSKIIEKRGFFDHKATIYTNDPAMPKLQLRIIGSVREHLGITPSDVLLGNNIAGKQLEFVVFSQVWPEFTISDVVAKTAGVKWEVTPADADALKKVDAQSGYKLTVTLPEKIDEKQFDDTLTIKATGTDAPTKEHEVVAGLHGERIIWEVSLNSPRIDVFDTVCVGAIQKGDGAKERITMKFRVEPKKVTIHSVSADPDFLKVDIVPFQADRPELGLFRIDLTIPDDAPVCDHMGDRKAEVVITTDHPKYPTVKFHVEFAVIER